MKCKYCKNTMLWKTHEGHIDGGYYHCDFTQGQICKCGNMHKSHIDGKCKFCDCKKFLLSELNEGTGE